MIFREEVRNSPHSLLLDRYPIHFHITQAIAFKGFRVFRAARFLTTCCILFYIESYYTMF